jgi:soluble lytic murein transglycosylase-like protein
MAERQRSIIGGAVEDAKVIDDAYAQLHVLTEELHDTKLMLTSAKKMITMYKTTEEKAVASYITRRYTKVSNKLANEIAVQTLKVSKEENVPVSILVAIMDQESGFNPMAVSPAGARGLMQVMPFWVKEFNFIKNKRELHDIYKGIKAGAIVLRYGLDKAHGNIKKALAIYKGPKYVAYVKRIMRIAGEFEMHKERLMAPLKSILETYYVLDEGTLVSMNGFGPAHFDSIGGYPPVQHFTNFGPYGGSGFTTAIG